MTDEEMNALMAKIAHDVIEVYGLHCNHISKVSVVTAMAGALASCASEAGIGRKMVGVVLTSAFDDIETALNNQADCAYDRAPGKEDRMEAWREIGLQPREDAERQRIAESCLRGQNGNRVSIAAEIIAGDLFDGEGRPKTYWHCLATHKPPVPTGRRGQWKAAGESPSGWYWQDWGAA